MTHWYHIYADGNWLTPVHEHVAALERGGLLGELELFAVGMVGSPDNCDAVVATLDQIAPSYTVVAMEPVGWEQVTLNALYEWVRDENEGGLVAYGHTKGASRNDPIDQPWRRAMEYFCFLEWRRPVEALMGGAAIAGCYWHQGGESPTPGYGFGGMFGGNFWWTHAEHLARSCPPGQETRHHAEHWLGQLSEYTTPLNAATICDLTPGAYVGQGAPDWI
jgi:hypothetical protein